MSDTPILCCKQLKKTYTEGPKAIEVLNGIDFTVGAKQTLAILGASGSGKSTLLQILGGLDKPSSGEVIWKGESVAALSERRRCHLRNQLLGFVYQFHHLLPEFSAIENVAMPLLIANKPVSECLHRAEVLLTEVGLRERLTHKPSELSGGERQRVAIARALVTDPACVLADEPTGNLDQKTAGAVMEAMLALQEAKQTSFIIVTHNESLANRLAHCYSLENGLLQRSL